MKVTDMMGKQLMNSRRNHDIDDAAELLLLFIHDVITHVDLCVLLLLSCWSVSMPVCCWLTR